MLLAPDPELLPVVGIGPEGRIRRGRLRKEASAWASRRVERSPSAGSCETSGRALGRSGGGSRDTAASITNFQVVRTIFFSQPKPAFPGCSLALGVSPYFRHVTHVRTTAVECGNLLAKS